MFESSKSAVLPMSCITHQMRPILCYYVTNRTLQAIWRVSFLARLDDLFVTRNLKTFLCGIVFGLGLAILAIKLYMGFFVPEKVPSCFVTRYFNRAPGIDKSTVQALLRNGFMSKTSLVTMDIVLDLNELPICLAQPWVLRQYIRMIQDRYAIEWRNL